MTGSAIETYRNLITLDGMEAAFDGTHGYQLID